MFCLSRNKMSQLTWMTHKKVNLLYTIEYLSVCMSFFFSSVLFSFLIFCQVAQRMNTKDFIQIDHLTVPLVP